MYNYIFVDKYIGGNKLQLLSKLHRYRIKKQNKRLYNKSYMDNDNKFEYEYLYPKNIDCFEYIKILNNSIINPESKNIALSGGYGIGKSSILKTFVNSNSRHKILNISLANFSHFQGNIAKNKSKSNDNTENNIINKIEENIVKQMFYTVKYSKIPFSRYKKIEHISNTRNRLNIILINIFIFVSIYIFKPNIIYNFIDKLKIFLGKDLFTRISEVIPDWINVEKSEIVKIMFLVVFFIGCLELLIILKKNISLAKWTIRTKNLGEVELGKNISEESIFNKDLDEILYFFEATHYNVVIFEDLDRFNNIDIFVRLRELNMIINNSEQINRKITFIYAIRDDIFNTYTDRNKFFDLIIPVVPVINALNSEEHFQNRINDNGKNVSDELIKNVSLHISDMRTLINICNEFKLYKKQLNKSGEEILNKLFAMIVYKNIEPVDFWKLHNGEGLIGELFSKRDLKYKMIEVYKSKKINEIISECDSRIGQLQEEFLSIFDEDTEHVYSITNEKLSYEGISLIKQNLNKDDLKLKVFKTKDYLDYDIVDTKSNIKIKVKELLNNNKKGSYKDRQQYFIEERDLKLKDINKLIDEKFKDFDEQQNISIKRAINDFGKDILCEELRNKELLVYFIKKGYIDENYNDYITYFYPGYITYQDNKFLISLQGMNYLGFDYKLNNVERVIEKINVDVFNDKSILNYYLIDYIIKNKKQNKYKVYYDELVKNIEYSRKKTKENLHISSKDINTFIYKYTLRNIEEVLSRRNDDNYKCKEEFIKSVIDINEFARELKREKFIDEIIIKILIYSTEKLDCNSNLIYRQICSTNSISSYISSMDNFLELLNYRNVSKGQRIDKLTKILSYSNIKFRNLNLKNVKVSNNMTSELIGDTRELMNNIINEKLYDINYNMLKVIINEHLKINIKYFNFSIIKEYLSKHADHKKDNKLKESIYNYICEFIDDYITEIYNEFMYKENVLDNNSGILDIEKETLKKDIEYLMELGNVNDSNIRRLEDRLKELFK